MACEHGFRAVVKRFRPRRRLIKNSPPRPAIAIKPRRRKSSRSPSAIWDFAVASFMNRRWFVAGDMETFGRPMCGVGRPAHNMRAIKKPEAGRASDFGLLGIRRCARSGDPRTTAPTDTFQRWEELSTSGGQKQENSFWSFRCGMPQAT